MFIDKLIPALMAQNKTLKPMLEIAHKKAKAENNELASSIGKILEKTHHARN